MPHNPQRTNNSSTKQDYYFFNVMENDKIIRPNNTIVFKYFIILMFILYSYSRFISFRIGTKTQDFINVFYSIEKFDKNLTTVRYNIEKVFHITL